MRKSRRRTDRHRSAPGRGGHTGPRTSAASWRSPRPRPIRWKKKHGGVGVREWRGAAAVARRESAGLKQVVADLTLDKQILRESLRKKW